MKVSEMFPVKPYVTISGMGSNVNEKGNSNSQP